MANIRPLELDEAQKIFVDSSNRLVFRGDKTSPDNPLIPTGGGLVKELYSENVLLCPAIATHDALDGLDIEKKISLAVGGAKAPTATETIDAAALTKPAVPLAIKGCAARFDPADILY